MPKSKPVSHEAKLKKKRQIQQEKRRNQQQQQQKETNQQQQQQELQQNIELDEVQIDTTTKNVVADPANLLQLGKRLAQSSNENNIIKRQRTENQQEILQEVIEEVDNGEILKGIPTQQRKSLIDYMGRKFKELQDSQSQFQNQILQMQNLMMQRMENIELQFKTFLSSTADMLGNNEYKIKENLQQVFEAWEFNNDSPKFRLYQQVQALEKHELSQVDTHCTHNKLNHWYKELKFIQFATYMVILEQQGAAQNTIKNNANSLRKISSLLIENDINVLTRRDYYKVREFLLEKYQNVNMLTTIRGYLSDYCSSIKIVTGVPLKVKIAYKEFGQKRPLIQLNDIYKIIEYYKGQEDERLKLLSFFLYLLVLTGARNETIRTLRFDQFLLRNEGMIGEEYVLQLYASKTGKATEVKINKDIYIFVQEVQNKRLKAMDLLIQERNNQLTFNEKQLIERRRNHLFTFYSQASLHLHIKKMKLKFKEIKNINQFIVHNIRTLRLIDIFESQGLQAAQQFAGHNSALTTLNNYLNKKDINQQFDISWGQSANDLNINDMKHFDSVVKKNDLLEEKSDSEDENLDKNDLLDEDLNQMKQNIQKDKNQNDNEDDDEMIIRTYV